MYIQIESLTDDKLNVQCIFFSRNHTAVEFARELTKAIETTSDLSELRVKLDALRNSTTLPKQRTVFACLVIQGLTLGERWWEKRIVDRVLGLLVDQFDLEDQKQFLLGVYLPRVREAPAQANENRDLFERDFYISCSMKHN